MIMFKLIVADNRPLLASRGLHEKPSPRIPTPTLFKPVCGPISLVSLEAGVWVGHSKLVKPPFLRVHLAHDFELSSPLSTELIQTYPFISLKVQLVHRLSFCSVYCTSIPSQMATTIIDVIDDLTVAVIEKPKDVLSADGRDSRIIAAAAAAEQAMDDRDNVVPVPEQEEDPEEDEQEELEEGELQQ